MGKDTIELAGMLQVQYVSILDNQRVPTYMYKNILTWHLRVLHFIVYKIYVLLKKLIGMKIE